MVSVAHAPSNVKNVAGGKFFTFIAIVVRNGMGTLLRATSRLDSDLLIWVLNLLELGNPSGRELSRAVAGEEGIQRD